MTSFCRVLQGVEVTHLLDALEHHPDLWNQNDLRTTFENSPHAQVSDIWLRFNEKSEKVIDDCEAIDYPAYAAMPAFRKTVMAVFAYVGGERLGRVMITRLPPGGRITPHADQGAPAIYYQRFHLALQGAGTFRCLDETVRMESGELWWVDNSVEHEVINDSEVDRLHLIIDARCADWFQSVYGTLATS